MNSILYALFEDNPGLPEEVYRFCLARPAYRAAERDYRAAMDRAAGSLDRELLLDLDQAVGPIWPRRSGPITCSAWACAGRCWTPWRRMQIGVRR